VLPNELMLVANFKRHYNMKIILTLLFPVIFGTTIYGQVITYDDFKTVIPFLQKEDFKEAFKKTSQLLSTTQNDSSDLRGIVTYMNIFSSAGMVIVNQMTHDEFKKNADKYVGQWIVMPAHPCIDSSISGAFDVLQFLTNDGRIEGITIAGNKTKTNILCFEHFNYADPIKPSDFIGKNVRCGGVLEKVDINPNKSMIWISRLHISNAFAREMTPR
jgi:hypothetical protein